MFSRKEKVAISDADPVFTVRYIGCKEIFPPFIKGCTTSVVQIMWDNSPKEKDLRRVQMTVGESGVRLDFGNGHSLRHDIHSVPYCCVDGTVNPRIFSWVEQRIYTSQEQQSFVCHSTLFSRPEKALYASSYLMQAFERAYKHWKHDKNKMHRSQMVKVKTENDTKLLKERSRAIDEEVKNDLNRGTEIPTCSDENDTSATPGKSNLQEEKNLSEVGDGDNVEAVVPSCNSSENNFNIP